MDLRDVPYAKLNEQMITLFMAINGRLNSIESGLQNPAIMTEPLKRQVKKAISDLHTRLMTLNNSINPPVAAVPPMTPAPRAAAAVGSPFFIHREGPLAATPETPVYTGPYVRTPGSSRKERKSRKAYSRKNRNKKLGVKGGATGER